MSKSSTPGMSSVKGIEPEAAKPKPPAAKNVQLQIEDCLKSLAPLDVPCRTR